MIDYEDLVKLDDLEETYDDTGFDDVYRMTHSSNDFIDYYIEQVIFCYDAEINFYFDYKVTVSFPVSVYIKDVKVEGEQWDQHCWIKDKYEATLFDEEPDEGTFDICSLDPYAIPEEVNVLEFTVQLFADSDIDHKYPLFNEHYSLYFNIYDECLLFKHESLTVKSKNQSNDKNHISDLMPLYNVLDNLIGLNTVKNDVKQLASFVQVQQLRKKAGNKTVPVSLHIVFSGNPGTGKTTVARILASIYKQIGILSKGHLVEVERADLVAGYVGQTALKTKEKIEEALGGILFIDEAYTLAKGDNDFGQEAIETILKAMEDHRDDFIVIVAGYPKLMSNFINSNPGLKSRFNKYFVFEDYDADELKQIFYRLCKEYGYVVDAKAKPVVSKHIENMVKNKDENFANARDIRNYFEQSISKQAVRLVGETGNINTNMNVLKKEDLI